MRLRLALYVMRRWPGIWRLHYGARNPVASWCDRQILRAVYRETAAVDGPPDLG